MKNRIRNVSGQGLVEYGLILALVSVVAVSTIGNVGNKVSDTFNGVNIALDGGGIYSEEEIQEKIDEGYVPIASAEELDSIRNDGIREYGSDTPWVNDYEIDGLHGEYIQVADIDLGDFDNWEPIGYTGKPHHPFVGVFDGGGYEIRNLKINRPEISSVGLFGYANRSTLKNIQIRHVDVLGHSNTGSLLGNGSYTTVENVHSSGCVMSGGGYVGGLIGIIGYNSEVVDSSSIGSAQSKKGYVGGLIGTFNSDTSVKRSFSHADVLSDGDYVGGLVGHIWNESVLKDSYSTGSVLGKNWVGGLVGYPQTLSKVVNSYSIGLTEGTGSFSGGVIGQFSINSSGESIFYDKQTTNQVDSGKGFGKSTSEMKDYSTYTDWDFDHVWKIKDGQYPTLRWQ